MKSAIAFPRDNKRPRAPSAGGAIEGALTSWGKAEHGNEKGTAAQPQGPPPFSLISTLSPSTTASVPHAPPTQNLVPFARPSRPPPQRRISRLPPATRPLHCLTMSNKDFYGGGTTQYPPQAYQPPPGPPPGQGGYYPPQQGYGYPPQGGYNYQQQQPMYVQQQSPSGGGSGATGCLAW